VSAPANVNRWTEPEWALSYLRERDSIPHRVEGLEVMLELLPERVDRVLDLGTGDGNTLALVLEARPRAKGVGLDFQDEMLNRARERFAGDARVTIARHDLDDTLPEHFGEFDLVVSSFAIHHLVHPRQRALYGEVFARLRPGGRFVNVEHVASRSDELHIEFLAAIGRTPATDDPSNKLAPVSSHLEWLDDQGFRDAECFWKWRELAVVSGTRAV
jgi:SAM-dependent methyltransferase